MIVIGDVHGCYRTLQALVEQLPHKNICFVGDLIDRGEYSADVVKYVRDNKFKVVQGNHEAMATAPNFRDYSLWMYNGGVATVDSYEKIDDEHQTILKGDLAWMKTLPKYITYKNPLGEFFIISHSNITFNWNTRNSKPDEFDEAALWSRTFIGTNELQGTNVIGHTPVVDVTKNNNIIMIDTGCVFNKKLSAIDLDTNKIYTQDNIEN